MNSRRIAFAAVALAGLLAAAAPRAVDFQREVRPLLSNSCFTCHGFDAQARMADLRLDTREGAFASRKSGALIVPGNPQASLLYQRIAAASPAKRMPPAYSHKAALTAAQQDTIKRWIAEGAAWKEHWSYIAPSRPAPPAVRNTAWIRTPVDAFVLARLESAGLTPAAEADRRTLARRVTLDLTGLPPTPAEVEAFVKDVSADAYNKLVDRLLASPHYGEHRGRYWLDAARYADTHGIHNDNYREMWPYRDWVIAAFNRNMPFDQFTIDQIAGDLMPNRTIDQQIASGFHRCNVTTAEGGSIDEEVLAMYAKDRVDTTGQVFLGLTIGCATCHDHKFDPIMQRDFYAMAAFFRNTTQPAMDGNIAQTPPVIIVPQEGDRGAWEALTAKRTRLANELQTAAKPMEPAQTMTAAQPVAGEVDRAAFGGVGPFTIAIRFEMPVTDAKPIRLIGKADKKDHNRGWMLDVDGAVPVFKLNGDQDQQATIRGSQKLQPGSMNHLVISHDGAPDGGGLVLFVNGKPGQSGNIYRIVKGSITNNEPVTTHEAVREARFFSRVLSGDEARLLALWPTSLWDISTDLLYQYALVHEASDYRERAAELAQVDRDLREMRRRNPVTHVMQEKADSMPVARVLYRGAYDQPREEVTPAVPGLLPPIPENLPKNRLGLAKWMVAADNPLMARVTVNRFWQELFGTGLVKTVDDFGSQGEAPSHPELLDWLAVEFRESGWNVKQFMRLLVTSNAYRQAAISTPEKIQKDPDNRLMSRGPRFRMDAEMVRDYALASSGLLNSTIGGPSVKPYQPDGIWEAVAMDSSDTRFYKRDGGDKLYRRSMYTFWKRSAPPPSMDTFNAPTREACTVRRERTNTPLQALVTMNDVQFVEAARVLAETSLHAKDPVAEMAARVLARPLQPQERKVLDRALASYRAQYTASPASATKLAHAGEKPADQKFEAVDVAAHTMLANLLLNLDEALAK